MKNLVSIAAALSIIIAPHGETFAKTARSHKKLSKLILLEAPTLSSVEASKPQPKEVEQFAVTNEVKTPSKSGKTEGNYVGFDLIGTKMSFKQYSVYPSYLSPQADTYIPNLDNGVMNSGVGLNYKYAINLNKFFVAPGFMLEQHFGSNTQTTDYDNRLRVSNRFAAKLDFGYDITQKISPYVTVGYGGVSYTSKNWIYDEDNVLRAASNRGTAFAPIYGFGLKVNVVNDLYLNAEYNIQHFDAKTKIDPSGYSYLDRVTFKAKLEAFKIGLSYNF